MAIVNRNVMATTERECGLPVAERAECPFCGATIRAEYRCGDLIWQPQYNHCAHYFGAYSAGGLRVQMEFRGSSRWLAERERARQ